MREKILSGHIKKKISNLCKAALFIHIGYYNYLEALNGSMEWQIQTTGSCKDKEDYQKFRQINNITLPG